MLPKIDKIADPIAEDHWHYKTKDGKVVVARILIGRPARVTGDFEGDWFCPVSIEGFTDRVVPAMGVGPVDALMNAITLVRSFAEKIGDFTPRAAEHDK
jgi:hypothetical protein